MQLKVSESSVPLPSSALPLVSSLETVRHPATRHLHRDVDYGHDCAGDAGLRCAVLQHLLDVGGAVDDEEVA